MSLAELLEHLAARLEEVETARSWTSSWAWPTPPATTNESGARTRKAPAS